MRKQLRIAELVLTIESDGPSWQFPPDGAHRLFEVHGSKSDACLRVHWAPYDGGDLGREMFSLSNAPDHLPPSCRFYRGDRDFWAIEANDREYEAFSRRVAVLSPDFARGEVYVQVRQEGLAVFPNPLGPPLDRVLFVNLMAQRSGMLIHACGVVHEGRGYLFAGPSGAGKTTMARLWSRSRGVTVLGEECLALRARDAEFWVYGTPWIGESYRVDPGGAPLAGIFFIRHDRENLARPMPIERAVENLLVRSFLVAYDAKAAGQGLDFCLALAGAVPAYDFGFLPDESAVACVQTLEGHGRVDRG